MSLRIINNVLSVAIIVLALYIFFLPVLPEFGWWFKHSAPLVSQPVHHTLPHRLARQIPTGNRLVVPSIDLDQPIYEGRSVTTVNKGIWLRPTASTPDHGSNTVMVGHRLTYTQPRGVFYYLDKINIGDPIEVDWHGTAYIYTVKLIEAVTPQDTTVEAPSSDSQLTLYTCTPLWSLKDRLVIVAQKVSQT